MIPVTDVARIVKEEVDKALSEINNQKENQKNKKTRRF
jgi:hypothetical protein